MSWLVAMLSKSCNRGNPPPRVQRLLGMATKVRIPPVERLQSRCRRSPAVGHRWVYNGNGPALVEPIDIYWLVFFCPWCFGKPLANPCSWAEAGFEACKAYVAASKVCNVNKLREKFCDHPTVRAVRGRFIGSQWSGLKREKNVLSR